MAMQITFALSREDFSAFSKIACRKLSKADPIAISMDLFAWGAIGAALQLSINTYRKYPQLSGNLQTIAIIGGISILLLIAGRRYKQHIQRNIVLSPAGQFLAQKSVVLDPDRLLVSGPDYETSYRWAAFLQLEEDSKNMYLFLDNAQAIILPKAVLPSPESVSQITSWFLENKKSGV
jgi:hypothetical protein